LHMLQGNVQLRPGIGGGWIGLTSPAGKT